MTSKTQETLMRSATFTPSDAHHQLAEVLTGEEPHEAAGCVLQSSDDLFPVTDAARAQPLAHLLREGGKAMVVVEDDETLDLDAPAQHRREQRRRAIDARRELLEVVPGDEPAERHTCADVEERHDGVQHLPAHALEVDVDPLRAGRHQPLAQLRQPMVEAGIEAEDLHRVVAFGRAAGDSYDAAALQFGDLADH